MLCQPQGLQTVALSVVCSTANAIRNGDAVYGHKLDALFLTQSKDFFALSIPVQCLIPKVPPPPERRRDLYRIKAFA